MTTKAGIDSEGQKSIAHEARFDKVVGWTNIVMTGQGDRRTIVWSKLPGSSGHTRLVLTPETKYPTRLMALFLKRLSPSAYELGSFWYGPWTPPEPWEPGAGPEALAFWLTHAVLKFSFEDASSLSMTDRMPEKWQEKIDLYGDTEVVKQALQKKEEPDPEVERLRVGLRAFNNIKWEIARDMRRKKADGTIH